MMGKKRNIMQFYMQPYRLPIIALMLMLLVPPLLFGQQEPMYGQYIFNNSVINPAQAGSNEQNQLGILTRYQWLGLDGGPRTQSAFINMRLPGKLGLAVGLYQDKIGPETNLLFQTDLAYHARLSESWQLAAGVRFVISNTRVNFSSIPNVDLADPLLREDVSSGLLMNVGTGLLFYNHASYIGVAIPRVFRNHFEALSSQIGNSHPDMDLRGRLTRHTTLYGGTNLGLTDEISFIPSTLFRLNLSAPLQNDLNFVFSYREILDFGPLLRSNLARNSNWFDAVGFLVGLRFLQNWYLGYMYEYPVTDLNLFTRQTHEISLRFLIDSKHDRRIGSPRYFL